MTVEGIAAASWLLMVGYLGACTGSYVSVVAHRIARGVPLAERSRCPACDHQLLARDNIPVLGWLARRGRCRHCSSPIPARYLLLELAVGTGWAAAAALAASMVTLLTALLLAITVTALIVVSRAQLPKRSVAAYAAALMPVIGVALMPAAISACARGQLIAWGAATGGALVFLVLPVLLERRSSAAQPTA